MISTKLILIVAIVVFVLMAIGLMLTMREFSELADESSTRAGERNDRQPRISA